MLNLKIKEKTLQEHREDAVKEFKIIQKRLILKKNETFEMEELEEIKESGLIEKQAKDRMNMRKANEDQIIYLDVE